MKYTKEQAEQLQKKLQALPPIQEKEELSKQEVIKLLKKDIAALQKRGYSLDKISEVLKTEGVEMSTQTLKNYLHRGKKPTTKTKTPTSKKTSGT